MSKKNYYTEMTHEEQIKDLEARVRSFQVLELPGQLPAMHVGTHRLVDDLWRMVEKLTGEDQ